MPIRDHNRLCAESTQTSLEAFNRTVFPAQGGYFNHKTTSANNASAAFYYFFTNQYEKITETHTRSVRKCFVQLLGTWYKSSVFPAEPTLLNLVEAVKHPALISYTPYLKKLINVCLSENLAIDLVAKSTINQLSLPSPFSENPAYCNESYEVGLGLNCLRFTDGNSSFFLMQRISSVDGLYFPLANLTICFGYLQTRHIKQLQQKLIIDFPEIIAYASSTNRFFGIIASHARPGHFYYDIWPILSEIHRNASLYRQIPKLVARINHDFIDLASVLESPDYVVLSSKEINHQTLKNNQFIVHIGSRRPLSQNKYRYEMADQFLLDKLLKNPSTQITQLANQIAGCYPVVWIGVEGQKRCWLEQIDGYAYLLNQLKSKYPKLGVVFDGWTLPLTPSIRTKIETRKDTLIVEKIIKHLNPAIKAIVVVGTTSHCKLYIGNKIDFFITNFSTGSLHVSRLLAKPGFCHASNQLTDLSINKELQIHPNNHVYLLPRHHVQDQNPEANLPNKGNWLSPLPRDKCETASYSIDKLAFYQFIENKLDKVLANTPPPKQRIFLEIPWAVNSVLRQYLKRAALGKCHLVFPMLNGISIRDTVRFSPVYLQRKLLYGNFFFGCHKELELAEGHYLTWLVNPLTRCYRHAAQLAKNATQDNQPVNIIKALDNKHKLLDNYYTRRLTGIDAPFGNCSKAMLDQAIANLKQHFIFIGIEEQPELSLDRLCHQLDLDRSFFPDTLAMPTPIETNLSEAVEKKLNELNQYDLKLYTAALKLV